MALTVVNVAQRGLDPVTDAAATATTAEETVGEGAAEEGASSAAEEEPSLNCGESFTPATKVLLASG